MRLAHPRRAARAAFTLVELLVVVAIIAILVSLTTAAVMKFLSKGPEVQNMNDIHQLEAGIAEFHRDFKLNKEFFPSRFVICEQYSDYVKNLNNPLYANSLAFLQRMFPRLWRDPASQQIVVDWNANGNLNGVIDPPYVLEGDQCLVFFLGGIPNGGGSSGLNGFSTNATNPAAGGGPRKGPYFDFDPQRLMIIHGNSYSSYMDAFSDKIGNGPKVPYAYFSSYDVRNGYNKYGTTTDCPTLGVWPYAQLAPPSSPTVQYLYPDKFQIISAGPDNLFGPGTDFSSKTPVLWTPKTAANYGQAFPNAKDDQTNFYANFMGVAQ
jgi:general secretion pathway protein G